LFRLKGLKKTAAIKPLWAWERRKASFPSLRESVKVLNSQNRLKDMDSERREVDT
jgi:hypothetical protein